MSTPETIPPSPDPLSSTPANAPPPTPPIAATLFLSQGHFFDELGDLTAITVSDWKVAARRWWLLLRSTLLVIAAVVVLFVLFPTGRTGSIVRVSAVLAGMLLVLIMFTVVAPRRRLRLCTPAAGTRSPGSTLLTIDVRTFTIRDRRESCVRDATGKHLGTLIAKPITARTAFTWLNADGTTLLTAREQSTLWTHAARVAESFWIAMVLRNLFHSSWHRKVTPHTTRHWDISPAPAAATPPERPIMFTPKQADPTPPPRWAQIQSITDSSIPIIIFPDCPAEHRLIPLLIAEYLEHHTLQW